MQIHLLNPTLVPRGSHLCLPMTLLSHLCLFLGLHMSLCVTIFCLSHKTLPHTLHKAFKDDFNSYPKKMERI